MTIFDLLAVYQIYRDNDSRPMLERFVVKSRWGKCRRVKALSNPNIII